MRKAIAEHGHDFTTGRSYALSSIVGTEQSKFECYVMHCDCDDGLFITERDGEVLVSYAPREGSNALDGTPIWRAHADSLAAKEGS